MLSRARIMTIRSLLFALPLLSLAACGAPNDDLADEGTELTAEEAAAAGKADAVSSGLYYAVRPDLRRCVFPLCGGFWLKKLNSTTAETYVAEIDYTRAGLDAYDLENLTSGVAVVRGSLAQKSYSGFGTKAVFAASAAYTASDANAAPSGTYYGLTDKNLVCAKAPCFNIDEQKLNWKSAPKLLSGITGALGVDALTALRTDDEILVAGTNRTSQNGGKDVAISAYWTRVKHYSGPTCATVRCAANYTCEMVQVYCIKAPCYPVPSCLMTDAHLVDLAKAYAFAKGDATYTKRYFDTEAEAYAAASTTPSLLWVARDGAINSFVWGYNDLWAERFDLDRTTGVVTTTAEH